MIRIRKIALILSPVCLLLLITGLLGHFSALASASGFFACIFLALGLGCIPALKGYQYTAWIIVAVVGGMVYPDSFLKWGEFDLRNKWLILLIIQLVMFGMGTQLKVDDFKGVAMAPKAVAVGLLCQFTIMPIVGFLLTLVFHFPPEIAAGIILIGSCSSGIASNVMSLIARANLVLGVTVTAVTTMIAPIMTPLLMKLLAGEMVEISFLSMMMEIIKIVLVPIGAALLADYLKTASSKTRGVIFSVCGFGGLWMIFLVFGGWNWLVASTSDLVSVILGMFGFLLGAVMFGTVYSYASSRIKKLSDYLPYISMFGIVYFTAVTTAAGREHLLQVGVLLFLAAIIHNTTGYFLGYWFSRLLGLSAYSARAVAFEVGLQNGGMASGLAGSMGKLGTLGLASAVFSPWMNISGSILANIWKQHPVDTNESY
jgi:bile acid:Na+ symporter, BASS family